MIAMAGIAEGALSFGIMITVIALGIISVLAFCAAMTGKRNLRFITVILTVLFVYFLMPWELPFIELSPQAREDPDAVHWFAALRTLAYLCYFFMVGIVICYFWSFKVQKDKTRAQDD